MCSIVTCIMCMYVCIAGWPLASPAAGLHRHAPDKRDVRMTSRRCWFSSCRTLLGDSPEVIPGSSWRTHPRITPRWSQDDLARSCVVWDWGRGFHTACDGSATSAKTRAGTLWQGWEGATKRDGDRGRAGSIRARAIYTDARRVGDEKHIRQIPPRLLQAMQRLCVRAFAIGLPASYPAAGPIVPAATPNSLACTPPLRHGKGAFSCTSRRKLILAGVASVSWSGQRRWAAASAPVTAAAA